jgi:hypothetical protein
MADINWTRVVTGGLVAGLVMNIGEAPLATLAGAWLYTENATPRGR